VLRILRPFSRALPYLKRQRRDVWLGLLTLLPGNVIELAIPWMIARGIDRAQRGDLGSASLAWIASAALLLVLLKSAARYAVRWLIIGASRRFERDLRLDLFRKFLTLPSMFYQRQTTGDLVSRMTADVEAVRLCIGPSLMYFATTATLVPLTWAMMFSLHPALSLSTLVPLLFLSIALWRQSPRLEEASRAAQQAIARVCDVATESYAGIRILKAFTQEDRQQRRMEECGLEYVAAQMRFARSRGRTQAVLHGIKDLGLLVVLVFGSWEVIRHRFTLGEFFLFNDLLIRMSIPMMTTGWIASMLHRGAAAMRRIDEIFDAPAEIVSPERPSEDWPRPGEVEVFSVSVAYGGIRALKEVSFRVPAGGSLGITGRTGSGKSTLASLLPRLIDPDCGVVRIGGRDVRDWSLERLRRECVLVPQEPFLFSASLRDNLSFGLDGEVAPELLERALFDCVLDKDLTSLAEGLDTRVGERGLMLSGGQRQRATLGRALLLDSPILVLDDCFSAIDTKTEALILERLEARTKDRTTLVISHRIQAIKNLDHILVLDQGAIVEAGTHAELLRSGGLYARLERRQSLLSELHRI